MANLHKGKPAGRGCWTENIVSRPGPTVDIATIQRRASVRCTRGRKVRRVEREGGALVGRAECSRWTTRGETINNCCQFNPPHGLGLARARTHAIVLPGSPTNTQHDTPATARAVQDRRWSHTHRVTVTWDIPLSVTPPPQIPPFEIVFIVPNSILTSFINPRSMQL